MSENNTIPPAPKPLEPQPGGAFAIVGGDTLRPPPPPARRSRPPPQHPSAATTVATAGYGEDADDDDADARPRDVELAHVLHRAGARLDPFVECSPQDLERRVLPDRAKGTWPWGVRYGEDGRPRWMRRVLPRVDFSAFRPPAVGAEGEGATGFDDRGEEGVAEVEGGAEGNENDEEADVTEGEGGR